MSTAYSIRVQEETVVDGCRVETTHAVDPLVLAVDLGTSSARALVYDAQGRSIKGWEVHRPYEVTLTPDGGAEADPRLLLALVTGCVEDVVKAMGSSVRRLTAVACDTFWHSLLGVDATGDALTPVYTWADTRSRDAARALRQRLDERAVHARTGAVLHPSYLPAKLLWLRTTQPELVSRVRYWMSFGEYLYLQLFGERRVSISMASGSGLLDQNTCTWDPELLEVLGIDDERLSPTVEFSDAMSGLRAPWVERLPAIQRLPWYLALGDGACSNIGSGGFCEEWAVAMIGTSGALRLVHEASQVAVPWGLWTYRVDRRRLVQGGALSEGGNVFAWASHALRLDAEPLLERELTSMPPDGHGLTVLPFLAGERSPNWNPDARSAVVGMRLDTTPLEILRAFMEAVAYRFGAIYDMLTRLIATPRGIIGSGAALIHSPAWMQIMTDVLGAPMIVSAVPEASSRGAALLVLESLGVVKDMSAVPSAFGASHVPTEQNTRVYRAAMNRQQDLYKHLIG